MNLLTIALEHKLEHLQERADALSDELRRVHVLIKSGDELFICADCDNAHSVHQQADSGVCYSCDKERRQAARDEEETNEYLEQWLATNK